MLNEELQHAERGQNISWVLRRPNTMNRFGFVLEELKLRSFMDGFLTQVLGPISQVAFPQFGGDTLDSAYAFTETFRHEG